MEGVFCVIEKNNNLESKICAYVVGGLFLLSSINMVQSGSLNFPPYIYFWF